MPAICRPEPFYHYILETPSKARKKTLSKLRAEMPVICIFAPSGNS